MSSHREAVSSSGPPCRPVPATLAPLTINPGDVLHGPVAPVMLESGCLSSRRLGRTPRMKHLAPFASACLASLAIAAPPAAVPFEETVHGIPLSDEYRWMEDPAKAAELSAWVLSESSAARTALQALPERAAFAAALREVSSDLTKVRDVQVARHVTVFRRTAAGDRTAKLIVRENGKDRVLIDPNSSQGSVVAINNFSLSPDGKLAAVHLSKGGAEVGEITLYNIATGQVVGAPIPNIWGEFALQWLGGDWVTYTQMAPAGSRADPVTGMRVFIKRVLDAGPGQPIFGFDSQGPAFAEKDLPVVRGAPWSEWVVAVGGGARVDANYWIARKADLAAGKPAWTVLATLDDMANDADVFGNAAIVLTTKTNPSGAIVRRNLVGTGPGFGKPATVFEGGPRLVLTGLIVAKDGLYVAAQTDGVTRLFYSPDGQRKFTEIKLPLEAGELYDPRVNLDGSGVTLGLMGWLSNVRTYALAKGRITDTGIGSQTWAGARGMQVDRMQARSADGTMVPLVVLHKKGVVPQGGVPTILEAYGSYGVSSTTPIYWRDFMAWLSRGGAMAFCGVRGGSERGRAWHDGGRSANKPNSHADFIACAQTLKAEGIATSKGVVGIGTSAGGVLVPPATLKQPGAFAGLVPRVGVLNASRLAVAPNGANQFDELGNPATPEGFKALLAMDAYHALATATDMPDTLIAIGLNDKRVAPWMSAKFAARAQAKFGDKRKVWLRAETDGGHGIGTAEEARAAEFADIFAFAWDRAR
ncbi:MAG: S9 family peptidase [Burkholderiales bacterium]|nr:S9 family peptidase [Burkholderiales bacterium]